MSGDAWLPGEDSCRYASMDDVSVDYVDYLPQQDSARGELGQGRPPAGPGRHQRQAARAPDYSYARPAGPELQDQNSMQRRQNAPKPYPAQDYDVCSPIYYPEIPGRNSNGRDAGYDTDQLPRDTSNGWPKGHPRYNNQAPKQPVSRSPSLWAAQPAACTQPPSAPPPPRDTRDTWGATSTSSSDRMPQPGLSRTQATHQHSAPHHGPPGPPPPQAENWQTNLPQDQGWPGAAPGQGQPSAKGGGGGPPSNPWTQMAPAAAPVVVRMSRRDAWARFAALEGCIQVCLANVSHPNSLHFSQAGFARLRADLGIGSLLLAPVTMSGGLSSPAPSASEICWEDPDSMAVTAAALPSSLRPLGSGPTSLQQRPGPGMWDQAAPWGAGSEGIAGEDDGFANPGLAAGGAARGRPQSGKAPGPVLRLQLGQLSLKGSGMLDRIKRWASRRAGAAGGAAGAGTGAGANSGGSGEGSQHDLVMYLLAPNGQQLLRCPVDARGQPVVDCSQQQWVELPEQQAAQPDAGCLRLEVKGREGPLAAGAIQLHRLWQLAMQAQLEAATQHRRGTSTGPPVANPCGWPGGRGQAPTNFPTGAPDRSKQQQQGGKASSGQGSDPQTVVAIAKLTPMERHEEIGEVQVLVCSGNSMLQAQQRWAPGGWAEEQEEALDDDELVGATYGGGWMGQDGLSGHRSSGARRHGNPGSNALGTAELQDSELEGAGSTTGSVKLSAYAAYRCALRAALAAESCGSHRLEVTGPWHWLLYSFAELYGVRRYYGILSHLQWMLQPGVASTQKECLILILREMGILSRHRAQLNAQESALMIRVVRDVEELLRMAFEMYPSLVSNLPDGTLEATEEQPLRTAVLLYHMVAPELSPTAHDWLASRWQAAARKQWVVLRTKWQSAEPELLASLAAAVAAEQQEQEAAGSSGGTGSDLVTCEAEGEQPGALQGTSLRQHRQNIVQQQREQAALRDMRKQAQQQGYASDSKLVKVYRSVQYVCQLMQEDLSFALALKNLDGLLPATPELPQATAEFYCQQFLSILRITLRWYPPLLPTEPAVDLLVSVARMQTYLEVSSLNHDGQQRAHLDALELFRPHVNTWIAATQHRLIEQCAALQLVPGQPGPPGASNGGRPKPAAALLLGSVPGAAAPLVTTMLDSAERELGCYQRVVEHWPAFGQPLEAAMCCVLREVLNALLTLCRVAGGSALARGANSQQAQNNSGANSHGSSTGGSERGPGAGVTAGHPPGTSGMGQGQGGSHQRTASAMPAGQVNLYAGGEVQQQQQQRQAGQHQRSASVMLLADSAGCQAPSGLGPLAAAARMQHSPGLPPGASAAASPQAHPDLYSRSGFNSPYSMGPSSQHSSPGPQGQLNMAAGGFQQQLPSNQQGGPAPGAPPPPPCQLYMREVALLNALVVFMGFVPKFEDNLLAWCSERGKALDDVARTAGEKQLPSATGLLEDVGGPLIGAQLAQLVKELRSQYSAGVSACASHLAEHLRSYEPSSIALVLAAPLPSRDALLRQGGVLSTQQVSVASLQQQWVEALLRPVLLGVGDALHSLRKHLEARVFVATARALWDYVGKDLYEFVEALQEESKPVPSTRSPAPPPSTRTQAWQARQHAHLAATRLDGLFRQAIGEALAGSSTAGRDLEPPAHIDRVHKLLQRSNAAANMAYTPF
ncbi:hypothetical protein V8C86DRAFT_2737862 [Haematococcus lacustris]